MAFEQWPAGGFDGSKPGGPGDDFADLDQWDDQCAPDAGFPLDLSSLADAEYAFEILEARLTFAQTTARLCEIDLQVLGGRKLRWTHWLQDQRGVNTLCAHLQSLGLPAKSWGSRSDQIPLSQALPGALAGLKGIKFRAYKSSRDWKDRLGKEKLLHDLTISCKLDGRPMPPLQPARPQVAFTRQPSPSVSVSGDSPSGVPHGSPPSGPTSPPAAARPQASAALADGDVPF